MENPELLQELEKLAERLDISVRYENGEFRGGLCRVKDEQVIIIHKKIGDERKISILARELGKFDLGSLYILPKVRELLLSTSEEK